MLADAATVIQAIGTAAGALLAGVAAVVAAWARREATRAKQQTQTGNGTTIGATVARVQAQLAEQRPLMEWARMRRASELLGVDQPTADEVHHAESVLRGSIDEPPRPERPA
jgi:hypothetical protein